MSTYYSRLARRQNKITRRQLYLSLVLSIALIAILALFGTKALFKMTSFISGSRNFQPKPDASDSLAPNTPSLSQDLEATNTAKIKITGAADPKLTIQLFQNQTADQSTVAGDDGKFEFTVVLADGPNSFQVQAISDRGLKSPKSETYTITYLSHPPTLSIDTPKDGDTAKDNPLTITGKTDPGVTVTINDRMTIVTSSGQFSSQITLASGDNKLKVVAVDRAGNQTAKELTVKYSP